jgi:DNA-binding transcriptional LysR family regulator
VSALDLGTVRVCAFPSANATLVPQAAAQLRANSPHMRLELSEAEPPESYAHLRRAECDIAIAFHYDRPSGDRPSGERSADGDGHDRSPGGDGGAPQGRRRPDHHAGNGSHRDGRHGGRADLRDDNATDGMVATPLLEEQWELLVPIGHRLVDHGRLDAGTPQAAVPLETLGRETWIAGCPTCRVAFSGACARAGFEPDIVCSTDDNMALQSLVAAGLGVTLVPHLVSSFLRHPRVVAMPVTPALRRHVVAYTWADLARVEAVRDTLAALRTVARDATAGRAPRAQVDA